MAGTVNADAQARLGAIWTRRRPQVLERVEEVERAVATLAAAAPDPAVLEAGRAAAHRLAGSLGMFGSPEGSAVASELETLLAPGADPAGAVRLVARLRAAVPPAGSGV